MKSSKKKYDEDLNRYKSAYEDSFKFNDENQGMLQWYASKIIKNAITRNKLEMLSFGIGQHTVCRSIIKSLKDIIERYIIIEGSKEIIDAYIAKYSLEKGIDLVYSYFEDFETDKQFDIIEMGFVLEHVDDPSQIVKKYSKMLKPKGSLFVAVPNARSLHRLIGYQAGLLKDLYQLSDYDRQLGHKRYFDLKSVKKLIKRSGLKIVNIEGIFLKPITTDQMKLLAFPSEIMKALYQLGAEYPEISNSILIEAKN